MEATHARRFHRRLQEAVRDRGEIRDKDEDAKRAARQARSKEVFDDIVACAAYQPNEPPSSGAGQSDPVRPEPPARRWRPFWSTERFRSQRDRGALARARGTQTRKTISSRGRTRAARRAAIAYTILACCRLADVNPVGVPARRAATTRPSRPPEGSTRPAAQPLEGRP